MKEPPTVEHAPTTNQQVWTILFVLMFLALQVAEPFLTTEIEHTHCVDSGHVHHHHDGTAHDHPAPSDGHKNDGQGAKGESAPVTHSHIFVVTMDVPVFHGDFSAVIARPEVLRDAFRVDAFRCPEGPTFALEKPPQLV